MPNINGLTNLPKNIPNLYHNLLRGDNHALLIEPKKGKRTLKLNKYKNKEGNFFENLKN